jgi:outer membrane lipoprotein-sorting protein
MILTVVRTKIPNILGAASLLALAITLPGSLGSRTPPVPQRLESLQCTVIKGGGGDPPGELWAKGDKTRIEEVANGEKVVTLQLADTLYTYGVGSRTGRKKRLGHGLESMGIIEKIDWLKERGEVIGSEVIQNEVYDEYQYVKRDAYGGEIIRAFISAKSSAPRVWSSMSFHGNEAQTTTIYYKDAKANPDVPDEMFKLPPGVKFSK